LVSLMVVETWVITLIMLAAGAGSASSTSIGDASIIRMVRLVKLIRLSRMARLLRAIPELVVLLKAVGAAARSILVFFLLWLFVIYVFAVIFRQITDDEDIGHAYFGTVPNAMNTLLLDGILPENAMIVNELAGANPIFFPIIMVFILLTSVTLMYMLIGVLVDVITMVAATEKEGIVVSTVSHRLRLALTAMGHDTEEPLSKMEFQELLVDSDVACILQEVGVNVVVLVDMSDVIYESIDKDGRGMTFENLVEVVLNMRGTNPATVKDVKDQLRTIKHLLHDATSGVVLKMNREFKYLHNQLHVLKKAVDAEESSQASDNRAD